MTTETDSSERAKPDVSAAMERATVLLRQAESCGRDVGSLRHNAAKCHYVVRDLANLEQAIIAACEAWAAQGRWADWVKLAALVTERDAARMLAEMNANLSAGHCRRMHTAEEQRDAAQQLLTWLATRIVDLADSHLCDIDSQTNCVCQDLQRVAESYVGADGKVGNIIDVLNAAQQDADALAAVWREFRALEGAGVNPDTKMRVRDLIKRGDATLAAHDARKGAATP